MSLIDRFHHCLTHDCALPEKTPVLLAVSGGLDSMVMAELFREADWPFAIAHCNFQLRGTDADGDAEFVWDWAKQRGIPCFVEKFDTKQYAETQGVSTQMAARTLRYSWFETLALNNGFTAVATAHHASDALETVLLNLIRGTGLKGLLGIPARAVHRMSIPVVRPLIHFTRPMLEEFARTKQIVWREDASNAQTDYDRNFLRHQVIPEMQRLNQSLIQTSQKSIQKLRETDENLAFLTTQYLGLDDRGGSFSIEIKRLSALPFPGRALREILRGYAFDEEQCRQIAEHLDTSGFELTNDAGWRALVERQHFRVVNIAEAAPVESVQIEEDDLMVRLPDGHRLMMMPTSSGVAFPDGRQAVLVEASALQFPLSLRRWQSRDVFQPFGMGGNHQTLQDYFTNQKLTTLEKEACWLLCNGDGTIIWVAGYRLDERFRVNNDAQRLMRFEIG